LLMSTVKTLPQPDRMNCMAAARIKIDFLIT
jgi:hypothetical protein